MSPAAGARISALRSVVGPDRVRAGSLLDAVDGVEPAIVVEPATVEEASAVLRLCSSEGLAVVPRGGGSKLRWGTPPRRLDVVLSTARLDAVLEHTAGDLVVRVQPGCRLEALQARLGASGQMLALDPPHPGATVGGVVASGASGPRRFRYGTARDLVIGITVVLSDGTVANAGGKVVKNVAGYDLGKLFAGSFGTLGLIAELTFRLHPVPEASRVIEVEVADPDAALAAVRLGTSPPMEPSAVELSWSDPAERGMVKVLYEGVEPGVKAQADRLMSQLSHPTTQGIGVALLTQGSAFDTAVSGAPTADSTVRIKVAHPPAALAATVRAAWDAASAAGVTAHLSGHAATGVTFVDLDRPSPAQLAEALQAMRAFAARDGGSAVVQDASHELKRDLDVWGPSGDWLDLMRRVKDRFDPTGTMSPGRFVGGI